MTPTTWIIIAVVLVVLLAVIAVVVGLQLRKRRQISLSRPEERRELTREEKSGDYRATSAFDFAEGGGVAAPPREKEPVRRQGPADGPAAPATRAPETPAPDRKGTGSPSTATPTPAPGSRPSDGVATPTGAETATDGDGDTGAATASSSDTATAPDVRPDTVPGPSDATTVVEPADVEPVAVPGDVPDEDVIPPSTDSDEISPVPPVVAPVERIEPAAGRMERLRGRLSRSQNSVGRGLLGLLGAGDLDEDAWEEIEDTLIMADLGQATTERVVTRLREELASRQIRTEEQVRELLTEVLVENLHPEYDRAVRALPHGGTPAVLLVVGVNGTGKTTTTGKLARVLVAQGRTILLGAADTFRAAAADQLQTWGERVGAETVRGKEGADPAAVAFDSVSRGVDTGVDAVLVDTAGRLHTKTGLMDQLGKVKRVVEKKTPVDEVLLVIDATTGQNGLMQARVFKEVVDITGVVLTKLDGTAKGGIVFQVQHELGVPVKLVGLGEGEDDLAPFTPEAFVRALLGY